MNAKDKSRYVYLHGKSISVNHLRIGRMKSIKVYVYIKYMKSKPLSKLLKHISKF